MVNLTPWKLFQGLLLILALLVQWTAAVAALVVGTAAVAAGIDTQGLAASAAAAAGTGT